MMTRPPRSLPFSDIGQLLGRLIPRHCLFCLEKTHSDSELCQGCIDTLSVNHYCCQRCANPLEATITQVIGLCGNCLSHDYYYDRVYSPYLYSDVLSYLIRKFKYQNKIHYARVLSQLFTAQTISLRRLQLPQAFIPVPMHPRRLRQRGFNQALELGRCFARHHQLPLDYTSLLRQRDTSVQAGLQARARQKNVRHAFALKQPLNYQHIALVDDVMTTGSTVNEAARELKRHGITRVDVWTIARAGT